MKQVTRRAITTTLYDVIGALHTEMGLEDDQVITAIVSRLMQTGQLTFHHHWPTDHDWLEHYDSGRLHDAPPIFVSQIDRQVASSIDRWEKKGVRAELAEGACDVQAAFG